jgi:hypothetical protein
VRSPQAIRAEEGARWARRRMCITGARLFGCMHPCVWSVTLHGCPASECAQSIKRTRSFAAMPVLNGLAPVYDRSGPLLDGYAAELNGAPAVTRALPHARAHSRRTIARASRPIPAVVAIRCGRTARALREGRRRPPVQTREDRSGLQARARRRERRLAGPAIDRWRIGK